jgi:hypothetical protein
MEEWRYGATESYNFQRSDKKWNITLTYAMGLMGLIGAIPMCFH